jgi:hypothetical protein
MPNTTPENKPEFILADSDENLSVRLLEQDIFERPEAYRTVFVLGALSLSEAIEKVETTAEGDVLKRLDDYFKFNFDKEVEFDDDTEDAFHDDTHRKELMTRYQKRVSSHGSSSDLTEQSRLEMRQYRLAFFVERVVEWNGKQLGSNKKSLRRTG